MKAIHIFLLTSLLAIASCGQGEVRVNKEAKNSSESSSSASDVSTSSGTFAEETREEQDPYYGSTYSYTGLMHSDCKNAGYQAVCVTFDKNKCNVYTYDPSCAPDLVQQTFMNNCSLQKVEEPYRAYSQGQCSNN